MSFYSCACGSVWADDEIIKEKEDNTATVPFGDTVVNCGGIDIRCICPHCKDDLEEISYEEYEDQILNVDIEEGEE